ncbi:MAG: PhoH family protein [Erysipelotrichaceae bacterium]
MEKIIVNNLMNVCGVNDEYLNYLRNFFNVDIRVVNNEMEIDGDYRTLIIKIIKELDVHHNYTIKDVIYLSNLALKQDNINLDILYKTPIVSSYNGKVIYPKTFNQLKLVQSIKSNPITFAIGPAGTGKTYVAVSYAISLYKQNLINKIILTRPAVEAGENLGFLPGDLKEKIDPYLIPLYDALYDILGASKVEKYLELGIIEIAPLAFMRGRTLDNAFVILDEAQNTTDNQMKMFLTRLGFNCKMLITGDVTQIDLPKNKDSGLINASWRLKDIDGISFVYLNTLDVVRHPIVQKIIEAYE